MSADASRAASIDAFLAGAGWSAATSVPLAGDASPRRYLRLCAGAARAVLMDADPALGEDVRPFLAITRRLRRAGLSAPEVLAEDAGAGLLLLEDLGDGLFARVCAAHAPDEPKLYTAAVDLIAEHGPALAAPVPDLPVPPAYDLPTYLAEARLAAEWYLAGVSGPAPADLVAELDGCLAEALAPVFDDAGASAALVLRDYHAENLLWLPGRRGAARVGLIDYQDALIGHPAYDLVSLLEDARRDTAPELRAAMRRRFLGARPDLVPDAFDAAYAALGAQRNLKIVGIFARLSLRDGKPRYLGLIPRVWDHLSRDLSHPGLGALARAVSRHLPPPEPATLARLGAGVSGATG